MRKIGIVLGLLMIIGLLGNPLYTQKQSEYVVIRQFGEIVEIDATPGVGMKLPFVQSISRIPSNSLVYDIEATELNTKDKKRIIADYYCIWRVTDPKKMVEVYGTLDNARLRLANTIYSTVRVQLAKVDFDQVINKEKNSREELDSSISKAIQAAISPDKDGIVLEDLRLKKVELPSENLNSIFQKMISERNIKAEDYIAQGDAEAKKISAEVEREVAKITSEAKRKAEEIKASAEQEAAQIYNAAYGKDAEFYKFYKTLSSYDETIKDGTIFVINQDSEYFKILK